MFVILMFQIVFAIPIKDDYRYIYIYIYIYAHTHTHTHSRVWFETVRFTTIHFYYLCRVGPSTPDLWYITVAIQPCFLYLARF
jgi:hypothetical protein